MFYAMDRFDMPLEHGGAFEARRLPCDSKLHEVEGFAAFNLLKGRGTAGVRPSICYTSGLSEAHFQIWLKSTQFKEAHGRPKPRKRSGEAAPKMLSRSKSEALSPVQRLRGEVAA